MSHTTTPLPINAHEELLAACKAAVEAFYLLTNESNSSECAKAVEALNIAITKAEGSR